MFWGNPVLWKLIATLLGLLAVWVLLRLRAGFIRSANESSRWALLETHLEKRNAHESWASTRYMLSAVCLIFVLLCLGALAIMWLIA